MANPFSLLELSVQLRLIWSDERAVALSKDGAAGGPVTVVVAAVNNQRVRYCGDDDASVRDGGR